MNFKHTPAVSWTQCLMGDRSFVADRQTSAPEHFSVELHQQNINLRVSLTAEGVCVLLGCGTLRLCLSATRISTLTYLITYFSITLLCE